MQSEVRSRQFIDIYGKDNALLNFFVKVIPPSRRARIHASDCIHCRDGQGQENQEIGSGPTYWRPQYPEHGSTLNEAERFMGDLGYVDTARCGHCVNRGVFRE